MKVPTLTPEEKAQIVTRKLVGGRLPYKTIKVTPRMIEIINDDSNNDINGWYVIDEKTLAEFTLDDIQRIIEILNKRGYK